ncbi:N-acetylneuraminate synthase family protein [bacterium]|nr:N-acetylneuraminate synthase family protein [bacterium]
MSDVQIGGYSIGENHPAFLIAEIGINHNGDLNRAKQLIRAARKAGANAVKFQSFKAEKICDYQSQETKNVEGLTGGSKSTFDLYKSVELSEDMHLELLKCADDEKILFLTSVFDEDTVDFLEEFSVPAYKIASSDVTHLPLIRHVARTGKPVIISTGMATIQETREAVEACYYEGNHHIVLLHCISCYPPADNEINLRSIDSLRKEFPHPIGYSDHCTDTLACFAACSRGASVIEKHFTLDHQWQGPDHAISAIADEFKRMVKSIRKMEIMLGSGVKVPALSELAVRQPSRRSIRAKGIIKPGDKITRDNTILLKPEIGLAPKNLELILGRRARVELRNFDPINWEVIE